ncbi:MAG: DNA polymerase domain-containing protein [Promethearchaeota archaeon]
MEKIFDGWLLDVSTFSEGVILWVKPFKEQKVIKLYHDFCPEFFAVPEASAGNDLERLKHIIQQNHNVKKVRICDKYVKLEDQNKTQVLGVSVKKPSLFKKTIQEIDEIDLFTLYNTDLPIAQMYFYVNDLFPMSFCHFKIKRTRNKRGYLTKLVSLELKDNNEKLFYDLPPLKAVWIDIKVQYEGIRPYYNDPLDSIQISIVENDENNVPRADGYKKKTYLIDQGSESEKLENLSKAIERLDPDIILTQNGDEFMFPYLAARASVNGISRKLYFSRDKTPLEKSLFNLSGGSSHYMSYGIIFHRSKTQVYFTGRFHLDTASYASLHFTEGNIPGVIEVARISRVSLQRLSRITIGGALQSIQYYNAYKLDHLIAPFKKSPEGFNSAMDLIRSDRGGHIFEPMIGVFDNIVELDFSSMYPSVMANYNISSETLNCKCCKDDGTGIKVPGLDFHICSKREGIIAKSIKLPLSKRLKYKEYVRKTGNVRYKFTDIALKWVLVVSFGYLGFKNARFGKIEAHQTVCAFAREFLMRAVEIAEEYDCKIVHGIVDSIWLQDTRGRTAEEFEKISKEIADRISEHTNVPMSWEGRYSIIVFLPSKAEPGVPALSHYWGIKSNGEVKVRGIEVRRRDVPTIVKEAQYAFIDIFQGAKTINEFIKRIPLAKTKFHEFADKIYSGKLSTQDLTIRQRISRKPSAYKVNSYQAIAARQLEESGSIVTPGKNVKYIILNANADPDFPDRKVIISDLYNKRIHHYDKKKYIELLKRAFENIFPFEFPELEEVLKRDYWKKSSQRDLSCFIG